jgi:hypothetical protein
VPLEIVIQSFDIANLEARMQAMSRPTYTAVSRACAEGKPSILFVPTRKQANVTAYELLSFAAADAEPKKFLQVGCRSCMPPSCLSLLGNVKTLIRRAESLAMLCIAREVLLQSQAAGAVLCSVRMPMPLSVCVQLDEKDLEPHLAKVSTARLRRALEFGVGLLHETQSQADQEVVNLLFKSGAIQVCAAPSESPAAQPAMGVEVGSVS